MINNHFMISLNMEIDFKLTTKLADLIKNAYQESQTIKNKNIQNKELNDIVTNVDVFMEKKIVDTIKQWFPTHSILAEECGQIKNDSEYEWLIDPIDGTINFAAGIPLFSTTVALRKNGEAILGVIYDYSQNDVYTCIKRQGAFCNGKPIHVSSTTQLKDSIVSFCLTSHYSEKHIQDVLNVEGKLAPKVRGLRLIVSSAIELAWCAAGKTDGVLNVKPSVGLSSAAGKLLVQEAGGKVTNLAGNPRENVDTMLVTNGKIHSDLVNAINN